MKRQFILKIKTAKALGLHNVASVVLYRLKLKIGLGAIRQLKANVPKAPFFQASERGTLPFKPTQDWKERALYFGWLKRPCTGEPPLWHVNPINGFESKVNQSWTAFLDFNSAQGDIKLIWEASRFTWVLAHIERYLAGENQALEQLNAWLTDWCVKNPSYQGIHWKCGQEAGIRVLHLGMGALLLDSVNKPTTGMLDLIYLHLQRIEPTLRYAMSQNNNHGTSEAAALFLGGSWLRAQGVAKGAQWEKQGRYWLENRVKHLIENDGSFSQYSVNYHRLLLDTLSMVELWRRALQLPLFSEHFQLKARKATTWLAVMVDPTTGDAPNIGANDSAYLFPCGNHDLRDFRVSVQTAMVLFCKARAYADEGPWNARLNALKISLPSKLSELHQSQLFDDGGYAVLKINEVMAILRYPRFRFRPSQADLMHVDLWFKGMNHLRDAGSYSYVDDYDYFSGTRSHNTIEFDDRDQMPRLSRFLLGRWLKTLALAPIKANTVAASYCDAQGAYHKRQLKLSDKHLIVVDEIEGFKQHAILRWRLLPADWVFDGEAWVSERGRLIVKGTMPMIRMGLVTGWESRYYLQKKETPVLEVEVQEAGTIYSEYEWMR